MSSLNKMNMKQLIEKKDIYHSVYFHQDTFKAACLAAGCLLEVRMLHNILLLFAIIKPIN